MPRRSVSHQELEYYRAHFREALREDGVVCLECGAICRALPQHVWRHGLPADQYKAKWGYNRGTGLVVPAHSEALRQRALARRLGAFRPPNALAMANEARRLASHPERAERRLAKAAAGRARFAAGWRPRRKKVPDEAVRVLLGEGLTSRQIAARTGLSYTSVRRRLQALGLLPLRPTATDAELLALRRAGLSAPEVAARTGLSASTIRNRIGALRRRGLLPAPGQNERAS